MVEYNFPWSGTSPGKAGPYSAELFRLYIKTLFTGLNFANAGVLLGSGDGVDAPLTVQQTAPASAQVTVTPGAALVTGGWYYTDSDVNVTIAANTSGNARIDYIILRFNATAQTITLVDLQGTPAGSPVPPTLTQTSTQYEIPLAQIAVANLFTTITTANINNNVRSFVDTIFTEGKSAWLEDEILIGDGSSDGIPLRGRLDVATVTLTHTSGGARATSAVSVAGAAQTIALTAIDDNALGYLSLASNQINIDEAGRFLFLGGTLFAASATAGVAVEVRLRNVTQGVTIVNSTVQGVQAATGWQIALQSAWFEANLNDKIELQIDGNATATITWGAAIAADIFGTPRDIALSFMRWRPLS